MSEFKFSMDMDKIMPKGIQDENLALDMISAGQDVLLPAIQSGAKRHQRTGSMANSLKRTKSTLTKNGDAIGRVIFSGKDKFGMRNSSKAIWLEYGTKNQGAEPFVRPAVQGSNGKINAAMQRVFSQKVNST